MLLGKEWIDAELAKPFAGRHQILKWFDQGLEYFKGSAADLGKLIRDL